MLQLATILRWSLAALLSCLFASVAAEQQAHAQGAARGVLKLAIDAESEEPDAVCIVTKSENCIRLQEGASAVALSGPGGPDSKLCTAEDRGQTAKVLAAASKSFTWEVHGFMAVRCWASKASTNDHPDAAAPRTLVLGIEFDSRDRDGWNRSIISLSARGNVVTFATHLPFDFAHVTVLGGDYLARPAHRDTAFASDGAAQTTIPIHASQAKRRFTLPPGWPASGRLAAKLSTPGTTPDVPLTPVVGAGPRFELPARIGDNRVRIDLIGEAGAVLASSVVDYSTPLPAEGAATRFTKTSFTWIANPLADDGDCPAADLPEAGVICTPRFRPINPRSCRYTCESISPSSYSLPTPIRFRHARSGGEWTEALKSGAESEVGGYIPLADRILRIRFAPGWPDNGFQVGLTLEDGTNDLFPAIRACREACSSECVTTVSVRGLRSGAVVRVKTFGPRTYNSVPIQIKTETTDALAPPEERRRGASFHFGAGATLALINRTPEGKEGDWFPLPGLAISGGGSYAWRDKFQLEGNLAARLMERPVIPFEADTGGPVVSEKLVYIHLSWQTLFLFRPMRQIQFGGGPGVDVAFPAVRANTYRGGGNDWMLSLNGSFRLQPFSYSRLMFVVDTNFYPGTEIPVWTVARTGAVTASDEGHVPFLVGVGMRGEWSPFGN